MTARANLPHRIGPLAALSAALLLSAPGLAQAGDILGACEGEIASWCSEVEPGNGHLAACLYAHEDKLGEACDAAVGDHGDMLDMIFEDIRFVSQECAADMGQLCGEGLPEGGGVFACLQTQAASLSPDCAEAVDRLRLPER